ncbi:MAG: hypothetical protein M3Y24_13695 [Acidobacteriota bacterium]|nr:hypothetical protein [Acidobacteriota bacterium]
MQRFRLRLLSGFALSAFVLASRPSCLARASEVSPPSAAYDALANSLLERAKDELAQVRILVEQGTLPKVRLQEAEEHLADAQDQVVLATTLYGQIRLQDMTAGQASEMIAAASRRVERQQKIVQDRRSLVDSGVLAPSEFHAYQQELESRERVLDLARNRSKLLDDLKEMAAAEQRLEHSPYLANGTSLSNVMIRYDGNGFFNINDLTTISNEFERKFHHALPVSALGQTMVHRSMGLDHRNRVDVSINPETAEGIWLRSLLERLRIPYLAFRSAFAGAATAPHIHIGPGSTRLAIAAR